MNRERPSPLISFILCSRNDRYMGNPVWRLQTALNYLAAGVAKHGLEDEVDIIVTDWGSETPLADVVDLHPDAARVTTFYHVPPGIAIPLQGDSPFPEVLALNAAARRARGKFIGRIDQDTLVGERFLSWLTSASKAGSVGRVPIERALLFANRRGIPYRFADQCPDFSVVSRFIKRKGERFGLDMGGTLPFWSQAVGIWMAHRDLWWECGGYDQRLTLHNWMETDMIVRLRPRYPIVDCGALVGYPFYHLGHENRYAWGQGRLPKRRRNPVVSTEATGLLLNPSGATWGLSDLTLEPRQVQGRSRRPRSSRGYAGTVTVAAIRTALDWLDGTTYRSRRAVSRKWRSLARKRA